MKIALCVPSWPPGFAATGIATYARALVPSLRGLGHEVFVLTSRKMGDDDPHTIDLQQFSRAATMRYRLFKRLRPREANYQSATTPIVLALEHLMKEHLDVFEMEESFGFSYAISRLQLLPVVVRLHGPWFLTGGYNGSYTARKLDPRRAADEGRSIRSAHFVTAPSAAVLSCVKQYYGLELKDSAVIPNGIKAAPLSQTWNRNTGRPHSILFVGRFDALKGADLVLRAFVLIGRSFPEARLTLVGPNSGIMMSTGENLLFEEFMRRYIPQEIHSRIEFRGQIGQDEVMGLRRNHFVTIAASRFENSPYSILEAMSLGCPIITTRVGGIPELVRDEQNGLLVDAEDVRQMADACGRLFRDPGLAKQLGHQAWQDCRDRYDPNAASKQTIDAYQRAMTEFLRRKRV